MRIYINNGFTLVELMLVLSIFSIIATMAVPAVKTSFDKKELTRAGEDLYNHLQLARSESITRFAPLYVRFNSTGANWQYGISQNDLCNLNQTDPTLANTDACLLVVDDGDGIVDDGTALIDAQDTVLYRFSQADYPNISMTLDAMPNADNQIAFDPARGTAANATITLQSTRGFKLRLMVGVLGQIRLCSPAGSGYMGGYSSDACV